jgi:hypothetical protein
MNPDDPEQYIRHLERGVSQTPEAAPVTAPTQPFGTGSGSPFATPFSPPPTLPSGFGTPFGGPGGGQYSDGPYGGFGVSGSLRPRRRAGYRVLRLVILVIGTIVVANAVYWGVLFLRGGPYHSVTTVHGHLEAINDDFNETIACNDGNFRLNGDNNTYTVTGHCGRLEVFGSGNHVTVDSADTISVFGDDNAMIYHTGSPKVDKTGNNNAVSKG